MCGVREGSVRIVILERHSRRMGLRPLAERRMLLILEIGIV